MTTQSPLTLYELTKQSLLNSETIASTALHDLPSMIFHEIFMEAFMGEHNEVLKVMVQAWPFPCLPLRTLMTLRKPKTPHPQFGEITLQQRNLRTLQALLDGIDIQLSQKVHHRWRLQVLDWRDVHRDFWTVGPRAMRAAYSEHSSSKEAGKPGLRKKKPTLTIFAHLCFEAWSRSCALHDELQLCLLKWARKRKASVHLSSEKVMIKSDAVFKILKLLHAVQLDSIQELDLSIDWGQENMKAFVPLLRKMTKLHTFHFSSLSPEVYTSSGKNKWHSRIYAFHLGQMQSLRELHIDHVFFLEGTLHKIFR
ncbi:melanoma antigen preferentially expressed in tumors-like [Heterocephalus glaber]|uniref:Melanoma antigen preferentially expressed in tumors-like n=1 Tax=Heterocephalus glaber TaxID=10181 RepID=A0AAX6RS27_HETGA|nr:melanoma antigen preferentially expressed in tumors-like [Heterocephalus glaber]